MARKHIEHGILLVGFSIIILRWYSKYNFVPDSISLNLGLGHIFAGICLAAISFLILHFLDSNWPKQSSKENFWVTRNYADSGIIIIPLFPVALIVGYATHLKEVKYDYMLTTLISSSLLVFTVILMVLTYYKTTKPSISSYLVMATSSSLTTAVILLSSGYFQSILIGIFMSFPTSTAYFLVLWLLLETPSKSFSVGEAVTVALGFAALFTHLFLNVLQVGFQFCPEYKCTSLQEIDQFNTVLSISCGSIFILTCTAKEFGFYTITTVVASLMYLALFTLLKDEPVHWLYQQAFISGTSICLVIFWGFCATLALAIVLACNFADVKITSKTRKLFHLLVVLIYVPGLLFDSKLLYLASCCVFAVFLFLEHVRLLNIAPFGPVLQTSLQRFLDEKDSGRYVLTHIYLLIGSSISLWILPNTDHKGFHLEAFAGVLSLGIGDTVASVCGTKWGRNKWPGSRKTLEGSFCAVVIQTLGTFILIIIGDPSALGGIPDGIYVVMATTLCCLLEGVTDQVDNLTLPLFLYSLLGVF